MPRNKRSLKSTKGDCPPPLFAHVAHHIKRATVAPRGWLHLIPLTSKIERNSETEYIKHH